MWDLFLLHMTSSWCIVLMGCMGIAVRLLYERAYQRGFDAGRLVAAVHTVGRHDNIHEHYSQALRLLHEQRVEIDELRAKVRYEN